MDFTGGLLADVRPIGYEEARQKLLDHLPHRRIDPLTVIHSRLYVVQIYPPEVGRSDAYWVEGRIV